MQTRLVAPRDPFAREQSYFTIGRELAKKKTVVAADDSSHKTACVYRFRVKGSTFVGSEEIPIVSWSEAGALFKVEKSGFTGRKVMMFDKHKRVANGNYGNRM